MDKILVIGARGTTGSRVAAGLPDEGVMRAGRGIGKEYGWVEFDWHAPETWAPALDGVAAAYVVPPTDTGEPAASMLAFLEQAAQAGLRRAVILSAAAIEAGQPGVGEVAAAVPDVFPEWAVLRPSWFMQNFIGSHQQAVSIRTEGRIRSATGDGRVPFVDAGDIARVAVVALTREESLNRDIVITGPRALTYDDVAATITSVSGRVVRHERCTPAQMRDDVFADLPKDTASLLADLDVQISKQRWSAVTDEVASLTNRQPTTFDDFAAQHASEWTSTTVSSK